MDRARERKEKERETERAFQSPQTSGGPIRPRGFNSPSCPGEEERELERERERERETEIASTPE